MAWRSSGRTNDEMVNNLKRFGVIRTPQVEAAFRAVDRHYFVPAKQSHLAHTDQPIREGTIHISAPHIYGTILEALDLPNVPQGSTFLNLGSGTGYLTCLVTETMGPHTTAYNVELQDAAFHHGQRAVRQWQEAHGNTTRMEFLQGNALKIHASKGEANVGFDRIYVGAALEPLDLKPIANLLRLNGVLVCPVGDELVKATRLARSETPPAEIPSSTHSFRRPLLNSDFATEVISGVRFTGMIDPTPLCQPLILPGRIWEPSLHSHYSDAFRTACRTLLLCANADPSRHAHAQVTMPRALWLDVLTYTHRDWFEPPLSEEDTLRIRLRQLEASLQQTEQAKRELEQQLLAAKNERDMYRRRVRQMEQFVPEETTRLIALDRSASWPMFESDSGGGEDMRQQGGERMEDDDDENEDDDEEEEMDEGSVTSTEAVVSGRSEQMRTHRTVSIGSEHA